MGGNGQVVEVDETFIWPADSVFITGKGWQKKSGTGGKRKIVSLVERGGIARSIKVDDLTAETIGKSGFPLLSIDSAPCLALAAVGVGNNPNPVPFMRGADTCSRQYKRPNLVAFSFQVSLHLLEDHAASPIK